jgi:hypothetical protein
MALTKVTGKGITDSALTEDKLGPASVTNTKIDTDAVTSAKIQDGQVSADDLASTLDLSSKTVTLPSSATATIDQNIALLGFKMAVNDGLTVFNLVDGVVDEFNDESGTDEAEGSNDTYCGTSDFYQNLIAGSPVSYSAGFTISSVTEPDTSTAGTNPGYSVATAGSFTVPTNLTNLTMKLWGAGGGNVGGTPGGGGGFVSGCFAVTPGQVLTVGVGENGQDGTCGGAFGGGFSPGAGASGGGATHVFNGCSVSFSPSTPVGAVVMVAGAGGGATNESGGAGGGLTGDRGGSQTESTCQGGGNGGGGSQSQGGQGGIGAIGTGEPGGFLEGGGESGDCSGKVAGGGGSGYYGGGSGGTSPGDEAGGGGSSFYGHPQVSSGSTEEGADAAGGGTGDPQYVPGTNETSEDGYVLLTGTAAGPQVASSTTIISEPFTSTSVATSARIVVFEEDVDSPTLNTDIIASISRDGTNFTNATLSDSGYVTGSSGQRILTGQADISGQPSGQSMRWKLALANNTVKIHGVALQWS